MRKPISCSFAIFSLIMAEMGMCFIGRQHAAWTIVLLLESPEWFISQLVNCHFLCWLGGPHIRFGLLHYTAFYYYGWLMQNSRASGWQRRERGTFYYTIHPAGTNIRCTSNGKNLLKALSGLVSSYLHPATGVELVCTQSTVTSTDFSDLCK